MATWEPIDIDPFDRHETADEDIKWDDNVIKDLEQRYNELRQFNKTLNESTDEDTMNETSIYVAATRHDIEELAANQIYDKLAIMFNNARKRLGINNGTPIEEPTIKYNSFKLADDGSLTFNNKKRSHTQLDSRKQVIAFQDRVITL